METIDLDQRRFLKELKEAQAHDDYWEALFKLAEILERNDLATVIDHLSQIEEITGKLSYGLDSVKENIKAHLLLDFAQCHPDDLKQVIEIISP
mgnify:CR=1 FL=1